MNGRFLSISGGGRVEQWCWVNFQCRGVLLIWIIVGQGPTALAVGAGGGCMDIISPIISFFFFPLSGRRLVGCSGFNGPLRQYFSLYRAVSQREGEGGGRVERRCWVNFQCRGVLLVG